MSIPLSDSSLSTIDSKKVYDNQNFDIKLPLVLPCHFLESGLDSTHVNLNVEIDKQPIPSFDKVIQTITMRSYFEQKLKDLLAVCPGHLHPHD
jgi:hypothetical protein